MIFRILNQFQEVIEHIFIGARIQPIVKLLLTLVLLLDFLHEELHFFFEVLVAIRSIPLIRRLELNLGDCGILVRFEHLNEHLLGLLLPLQIPVLLKLNLLKRRVEHQDLAHENEALVGDYPQMHLLNMLVLVTGLQNPQHPIIAQKHILETYFLNRVLRIREQGVSDVDARLVIESLVLPQHQLRDILGTVALQGFLEVEAGLVVRKRKG